MSKFSSESCHYYDATGKGVFEVPRKDGKGMRPTTIRDARELNLLPSVTTILSVYPKDSIVNYRLEQLLQAATTIKRHENEPVDLWHSRIIEVSEMHRNKAADTGKAIHNAIEEWLKSESLTADPAIKPHVEKFSDWFDKSAESLVFSEDQLINLEYGYCGTADLCYIDKDGRKVLADIKNQSVKLDTKGLPKPAFYDTWVMQLAAYNACGVQADVLQSIVINRDKAEAPHIKNWTPEEAEQGWRRFRLCLELFGEVKEYRYQPKLEQKEAA